LAAADPITQNIELVMVNDGSPDDSLDLALALHRADPRVVVVDLSRIGTVERIVSFIAVGALMLVGSRWRKKVTKESRIPRPIVVRRQLKPF